MGEAESYYRIFPSLHLSDSNIGCHFVSTGREMSRFLKKKVGKEDTKKVNSQKLVEIEGEEGVFYVESASILDKYWRRPPAECNADISLDAMSLAQFIKRSTKGTLKIKQSDLLQTLQSPDINQDIDADYIISSNPKKRLSIPRGFKLKADHPEAKVETMKLRKPLV